jgi:hypothetical protein
MKKFLVALVLVVAGCGDDWRGSPTNQGDLRLHLAGLEDGGGAGSNSGSIDFGQVQIGRTERIDVRLVNPGPDGVTIRSARFEDTPPGVFFAQVPDRIGGSEDGLLVLRFSPLSEGDVVGRLVLEHNGQSREVRIELLGSGR